jgi:hypothetical protein
MICTYLEVNPEHFLRNRTNGEPTIVDICDPVQFMIPTPKASRVIETMSKSLCIEILKWIIPLSSQKIKDNQEALHHLKKNQLQPLYHFLTEDLLWIEH